jgi:hypothetical protein
MLETNVFLLWSPVTKIELLWSWRGCVISIKKFISIKAVYNIGIRESPRAHLFLRKEKSFFLSLCSSCWGFLERKVQTQILCKADQNSFIIHSTHLRANELLSRKPAVPSVCVTFVFKWTLVERVSVSVSLFLSAQRIGEKGAGLCGSWLLRLAHLGSLRRTSGTRPRCRQMFPHQITCTRRRSAAHSRRRQPLLILRLFAFY